MPERPAQAPIVGAAASGGNRPSSGLRGRCGQRAEPGSRDWTNLQRLVQRTLASLKPLLLDNPAPLLLNNVGLLARYDLMALVTEMEASAGRPGHTPNVWLLLPSHQQGLPVIDGVSVPLVNSAQAFGLPPAWVNNQHRAVAMA